MSRCRASVKRPGFPGLQKEVLIPVMLGLLLISLPALAQDEGEREFKGVGVHFKLRGARYLFSGGDLEKGTAGMYDAAAAGIIDLGYEVVSSDKKSLGSGTEVAGDLIYYLTPKLGVGMGGSWFRTRRTSFFRFSPPGSALDYRLVGASKMNIYCVRVGVFYNLPINRLLTVCLNASPAYYFVDFEYGSDVLLKSIIQKTKARNLGLEGGVDLEIRMNPRLAFILGVQGRYARISGFDGTESINEIRSGLTTRTEESGPLYLVEGEEHPRLDILLGGPAAGVNAKKAILDLTGLSFQAGFNFKF